MARDANVGYLDCCHPEKTADAIFSGIGTCELLGRSFFAALTEDLSSVAHLPFVECFKKNSEPFDIAFIGLPFVGHLLYRNSGQDVLIPLFRTLERLTVLELALGRRCASDLAPAESRQLLRLSRGQGIRQGSRRLTLYGGEHLRQRLPPCAAADSPFRVQATM